MTDVKRVQVFENQQ